MSWWAGAHFDDDDGFSSGSAYVFRYDEDEEEWVEEQKLNASDAAAGDYFGWGVSIRDDLIAVGAYLDDDTAFSTGSAYVFRYDEDEESWIEEDKLNADDADAGDYFGYSVSVGVDFIAVGAYFDDESAINAGAAYVFRYDEDEEAWFEQQKVIHSDAAASDYLGISINADDEAFIVGAYLVDDTSSTPALFSTGAAYVYRWDVDSEEWLETNKFEASEPQAGRFLGRSVNLDGDRAIVGAYGDRGDAGFSRGAAFVYCTVSPDCNGNCVSDLDDIASGDSSDCNDDDIPDECQVTLQAPDTFTSALADPEDVLYGQALKIDGNTVVIGIAHDDTEATNAGAVTVMEYDGTEWIEVDFVTASDPAAFDEFGWSVGFNGEFLAVGTPSRDDGDDTDTGAVYIFEWDDRNELWDEVDVLTASDAADGDEFGYSIDLRGEVLVVGAWTNDEAGSNAGAAYVFRQNSRGDWVEEQKLTASDAAASDLFGRAVATDGVTVAVGATWVDIGTRTNAGAVYIFEYDSDSDEWVEADKVWPAARERGDNFGRSISVSDDLMIVGAWFDDEQGSNAGAAYIYKYDGEEWAESAKLMASDGGSGTSSERRCRFTAAAPWSVLRKRATRMDRPMCSSSTDSIGSRYES